MKQQAGIQDSSARFLAFASGFILFAWSAYALAAAGIFSFGAIATVAILSLTGVASTLIVFLSKESLTGRIAFAFITLYVVFLLSGTAPTIFSGRDQGSIAEAAIGISQNGTLSFSTPSSDSFFAIYGPGKALNFPGFFYSAEGRLLSQFPISYSAWLAAFHSMFGLPGLVAANGVLLALSLLTLFVLVRELSGETAAVGATLVAAASFLPSWFAKFTLTENFALFLFLLLSLSTVLFLRSPRRFYFLAAVFTATLLAITRIEGIVLLAITFGILFLSASGRRFVGSSTPFLRTAPIIASAALIAIDLIANTTRYVSIAKALFQGSASPVSHAVLGIAGSLAVPIGLWTLFLPYGLLVLFLLGIVGILVHTIRKEWILLLPVFLALPTFLYLVDPNITADHPWMLRRLLFSVWPALLVASITGISSLLRSRMNATTGRRAVLAICTAIALTCLPPTWSVFRFSENGRLGDETATLSASIGKTDLVLVDRDATGDPYAMTVGPLRFLFGTNAAYFFNPDDFAKIPKGRYDHVYLLVRNTDIGRYAKIIRPGSDMKTFRFVTERLGPLPLDDPRFPEKTAKTAETELIPLDTL